MGALKATMLVAMLAMVIAVVKKGVAGTVEAARMWRVSRVGMVATPEGAKARAAKVMAMVGTAMVVAGKVKVVETVGRAMEVEEEVGLVEMVVRGHSSKCRPRPRQSSCFQWGRDCRH